MYEWFPVLVWGLLFVVATINVVATIISKREREFLSRQYSEQAEQLEKLIATIKGEIK